MPLNLTRGRDDIVQRILSLPLNLLKMPKIKYIVYLVDTKHNI